MKKILLLLFGVFVTMSLDAQCVGTQSATVTPLGPYTGGQVITFCYTMTNWYGLNVGSNWLEGFAIMANGVTNITPIAPPQNCNGGGGSWIWVVNGPHGTGWFFEAPIGGPTDGNPSNDYGDFGTNCTWTFCFKATVVQSCNPLPLLVQVTAGADGDWGSWTNPACPTIPYTLFSGLLTPQPVTTSQIFH